MNIKLIFELLLKLLLGLILMSLTLFIPANTIKYWNAWLFIILLFIPIIITSISLLIKAPNLLKSRLNIKEKEQDQKKVVILSSIMFLAGFIIAGLNYRLNWILLPNIIVVIASIIFLLSYLLYAEVLRENAFLSRTIEVKKEQKVIKTGLYKIVRHPMYFSTLVLFLSIPLILGSLISFIIFLIYPFIIIKRIKSEEQVLEKKLKGYKEYQKQVKYRLIPYIW